MARLQHEAGGPKVSWQSEQRLRFAGKGLTAKGLRTAVTAAGLQVVAVRRLRIGRVALGPLAVGQWRYLGSDERF
jgi:23S rRNA pseudouridine2604 synthase